MFKTIKRLYWYIFKHTFVSRNAVCDVCGNQIRQSDIKVCSQSKLVVEQGGIIEHSTILLYDGAILRIGKNAVLRDVKIDLRNTEFTIAENVTVLVGSIVGFKQSTIGIESSTHCKHIDMVVEQSKIEIGKSASFSNLKLIIENESCLKIGEAVLCEQGNYWCGLEWIISQGAQVMIGHHNRMRSNFWVRFGARVKIDSYNCINEGTEIRADEQIVIGSYNMISYNCRIWDTNTHCFYNDGTRRKMTEDLYPNVGAEKDKPQTSPIMIGDDCLIGEGVVVMKGTRIGNKVKVGTRAVVSNMQVPDDSTVVAAKSRIIGG